MNNINKIIKEEAYSLFNEMSTRARAPIEDDGYWEEMISAARKKYGIDNVEIVGFNTKSPVVRMTKSGFKPVVLWKVKSEQLPYLTVGKNYEYITNWLLNDAIPKAMKFFQSKEGNIRKLPENASVEDKIKMLVLVGLKANEKYRSRKYSEEWSEYIYTNYGRYWDKLYDAVEDTPEWEAYRKENNIARSINFSDVLA